MIYKFNTIFVTLFGVGKIKFAPGTLASLLTAIILFYLFHLLSLSKELVLLFLIVIFFYSFYAVSNYIKKKDNKDPKEVVIDEVIGQSIPLYLYEISHGINKESQETVLFYIYIFILFRFFDIKKPFPISWVEKKFTGGLGIMLDDIAAAIPCVLIMQLTYLLTHVF